MSAPTPTRGVLARIWARITEPKIITLVQTVLVYGARTASRYTGTQNVNAWLPVNTSWKAA